MARRPLNPRVETETQEREEVSRLFELVPPFLLRFAVPAAIRVRDTQLGILESLQARYAHRVANGAAGEQLGWKLYSTFLIDPSGFVTLDRQGEDPTSIGTWIVESGLIIRITRDGSWQLSRNFWRPFAPVPT